MLFWGLLILTTIYFTTKALSNQQGPYINIARAGGAHLRLPAVLFCNVSSTINSDVVT